ncbi:Retrovirus-related Gag polyprotein from transposon gypsy [Eumeta japonica]|uniref:Retrovirus-related Gag polyprotein from transposon gypsy n=1 Tax=Eumeta variegata TaxID=151549 RepID=A0A4C1TF84_EUMVA|nr:Retrovirus-related Gag polyprotein from transposon gypsy [Eumeta japonica]
MPETMDELTNRLSKTLTMASTSTTSVSGLTELQKSQIRDLIIGTIETGSLRKKVDELTENFQQLTSINIVEEYRLARSRQQFNEFVQKGSRRYYAALILRNKITDEANNILTNHGTVLTLEAILSRLDFAYSDKRPIHIIEQKVNKTIMTHGSNSELTHELNKKKYALRVFITGLNPPLANILFSLSPNDLPNALAKAQELESNNIRANFALQFNRASNINPMIKSHNNLRFPQRNERSTTKPNFSKPTGPCKTNTYGTGQLHQRTTESTTL